MYKLEKVVNSINSVIDKELENNIFNFEYKCWARVNKVLIGLNFTKKDIIAFLNIQLEHNKNNVRVLENLIKQLKDGKDDIN